MNKTNEKQTLAEKVTALPSIQNEALSEIVRGLYQNKPLLGPERLLTKLIKDLTQDIIARRDGRAFRRKQLGERQQQT